MTDETPIMIVCPECHGWGIDLGVKVCDDEVCDCDLLCKICLGLGEVEM